MRRPIAGIPFSSLPSKRDILTSSPRIIYLDVVADPLEELGAFDFVHVRMIAPSVSTFSSVLANSSNNLTIEEPDPGL